MKASKAENQRIAPHPGFALQLKHCLETTGLANCEHKIVPSGGDMMPSGRLANPNSMSKGDYSIANEDPTSSTACSDAGDLAPWW